MIKSADHFFLNQFHEILGCNTGAIVKNNSGWHGFYFLVAVGSAIYYIQQSTTFGMGALGVLKGLVWPALVAYRTFELLNM
jgi:hypothetical protein